uniref:claudin-6-like n=1 Tax=Odobenus rosmarus divergens TaxID=9708 RepID=UPI00063C598F|nr:PREDICTED: claudin-6-like [Odobenus rosmarus divergens]
MAELALTESTASVSDRNLAPGASYIFAQVTSPKERLISYTYLCDPAVSFKKHYKLSCVVQSTGQMQCKVYDSLLALPQDLQAARALCVVALLLALLGLLVYLAGAKSTTCVEDKDSKALVLVSGIIFVISGVLVLMPICWTAHAIIRDFYNRLVSDAQKRELGASLYLGWAASGLLLLGGGLLCCTCPSGVSRGSNHHMA